MSVSRIPKNVAAAIQRHWPDGLVEEFPTDESYFHHIHSQVEWDLRHLRGASLLWQTEQEESSAYWDDDWEDWEDEPPPDKEWQSYHVFFLAPHGDAFHREDETESLEEPEDWDDLEDPDEDDFAMTTYPGERWTGCAVGISLKARFAFINLSELGQYEDGSISAPDVESFIFSDNTGERIDTDQSYRQDLGEKAFAKLEELRARITAVLAKHRIRVLEKSVLDAPVPGLRAVEEVFLQEPLRVRDAFFFRGI